MSIQKIMILGQGQMGSGIAQVAAQAGYDTVLYGRNPEKVAKAVAGIEKSLSKAVEKGRITEDANAAALAKIKTVNDYTEEAATSDLIIEAVSEDLALKTEIFKQLDAICPASTILATNTSSLPVTSIASVTGRPDKVIGMHFFMPVTAMKLVELIRADKTSDETLAAVKAVAEGLGKVPVVCNTDTPGFIVNRCLFAFMLEAIHCYEDGVATLGDIDTAMKLGLNHPLGPFEMMDMSGLDTFPHVCDTLSALPVTDWSTPQAVKKLVEEGRYGRKSGHGWHDYE